MSTEPDSKRWTAKRNATLIKEIFKGQTTISEAVRQHDLMPSEIEKWLDDTEAAMENALRAKPCDVAEQYEHKLKQVHEAYGDAMLELKSR